MFRTNYRKLAKELLEDYFFKQELTKKLGNIIVDKIIDNDKLVRDVSNGLFIYDGFDRRRDIKDVVAERVVAKLVDDVYDLQKAEVLRDISAEGMTNLLRKSIEDKAKEHVRDFINKPVNNGQPD